MHRSPDGQVLSEVLQSWRQVPLTHARSAPHFSRVQDSPYVRPPNLTHAVCAVSEFTMVQVMPVAHAFASGAQLSAVVHTGTGCPLTAFSMSQNGLVDA